uniref:Ig-like domain-containing protein n=1 Tax=Varanus komodoensis TaxID=61221 RepID=A0A8D2LNQ0_VARKO
SRTLLFPSPFYVVFTFYLDTSAALKLTHSRFIAARRGNNVSFNCFLNSMAKWYKEAEKGKYLELKNTSRVEVTRNESMVMVHIRKLQQADSGIYVCDSNISDSRRIQQQCCSTELRVMGISTFEQVQSRHTLKDAIIVIQSTLLVLFVSIPLLLTLGKVSVFGTPGKRPDSNIMVFQARDQGLIEISDSEHGGQQAVNGCRKAQVPSLSYRDQFESPIQSLVTAHLGILLNLAFLGRMKSKCPWSEAPRQTL